MCNTGRLRGDARARQLASSIRGLGEDVCGVVRFVHDFRSELNGIHAATCLWRLSHAEVKEDDPTHEDALRHLITIIELDLRGDEGGRLRSLGSISSVLLSASYLAARQPGVSWQRLVGTCASVAVELLPLGKGGGGDGSPRDLANIAWATASLARQGVPLPGLEAGQEDGPASLGAGLLRGISRASLSKLGSFQAVDICKTAWAYAALHAECQELFRAIADVAVLPAAGGLHLRSLAPQGVCNLAWAFARTQSPDAERVLLSLSSVATSQLRDFEEHGLANLAWSYAKAGMPDPAFFERLTRLLSARTEGLGPQALSMVGWALATVRSSEERLQKQIAGKLASCVARLSFQELANASWAFATLQAGHPGFWAAVVDEIAVRQRDSESSQECKPQELASLLWSMGKQELGETCAFDLVAKCGASRLEEFDARHLSNILWSFAAVASSPGRPCIQDYALALLHKADELNAQEVANSVWAVAKIQLGSQELSASLQHAARRHAGRLSAHGVSSVLWALATTACDASGLHEDLAKAVIARLPELPSQGLANVAWALATLSQPAGQVVLRRLAGAVIHSVDGFSWQEVSNVAWAFASAELCDAGVFRAISGSVCRRGPHAAGAVFDDGAAAKSLSGLLWSFTATRFATPALRSHLHSVLMQQGAQRDAMHSLVAPLVPPRPHAIPRGGHMRCDEPRVVLDMPDRQVLEKPGGWEVYAKASLAGGGGGDDAQLRTYVQARGPARVAPIAADRAHNYGFLHRLDVPSSGLVVVAKTYRAYYDLLMQLSAGALLREYIVLCHGWLPPAPRKRRSWQGIKARIDAPEGTSSSVSCRGKPAFTLFRRLAHAFFLGQAFSVAKIRILSGRRHQIRTHMAHVGYPTVCDGRYSHATTFIADCQWCPRNLLHRHRLAFRDAGGVLREVLSPLPRDLALPLARVQLRRGDPHLPPIVSLR